MATRAIDVRREEYASGRKDRIRYRAGAVLDECGPSNKVLASAVGVNPRMMSDYRRGDPKRTGPQARVYEEIRAMQVHEKTTPYPLLADMLVFATEALNDLDDDALVARFWTLVEYEAEREGTENTITATFARHGDLSQMGAVHRAEAAVSLELAAVCHVLDGRGVDPRRVS